MNEKNTFKIFYSCVILALPFSLSSCCGVSLIHSAYEAYENKQVHDYYSDKSQYASGTGTISNIEYFEEDDLLVLNFEADIAPSSVFTSRKFVVKGENLETIESNGFHEKVKVGSFVEFVSVRGVLFGFANPIVSLTVGGETLLEFEEGYQGVLELYE